MKINGKNYLLLRRRGCNFMENDPIARKSDVGNYRVFVRFTDKNGVEVCGDFGRGYAYDLTKKKPVIIDDNVLSADLQYEDERGAWVYRPDVNNKDYPFTLSGILAFVNAISAEHYDGVKFIEEIETTIPAGSNFTPAGQMHQWAKASNVAEETRYMETVLKLFTGDYKYLSYKVAPFRDGLEKVTITLELV